MNYTNAHIETLAVNGMASDDTFTVSNLTRSATLDGGAGIGDAIVATNDVDFTLANTSLARSGGQAPLTLASMEAATLTGGAADNSFTVSGWSGTGTLDGAGGTDSVVATNDVDFTLTNTSLARTTLGALTLASIESATLTGGAANNSFTVSGWSGRARWMALAAPVTRLLRSMMWTSRWPTRAWRRSGGQATLTLANIELATLTGGAANNIFTVSGWSGGGTLDGGAGTGDAIVATNDVDFTLTNASLARSGGQATLTLGEAWRWRR